MATINVEDITKIERCVSEGGESLYYILNSTEKFDATETAIQNYWNMETANAEGIPVEDISDNYVVLRASGINKYDSITDQLDQLYWDKKNGTSTWEEGVDAVKAAYPKPTE